MKISGDRSQKGEIVEALMDMLAKKVARRTLPSVNRDRSRVIVETVIGWWAHDNCEACTGRKMEPIPGTPHLSANWCSACNRLGTRPIPRPARTVQPAHRVAGPGVLEPGRQRLHRERLSGHVAEAPEGCDRGGSHRPEVNFQGLRAYYTTTHKENTGDLPDMHASPTTTARVYERSKVGKRKAI